MKLKITMLAFLSVFIIQLSAQDRSFRKIVTQEFNKELEAKNPQVSKQRDKIESYFNKFKQIGQIKPKTIPIVFHIVYSNDKNKVSLEQVLSQIEALNRDFNHEVVTIHHPAEKLEGFASKRPERIDINFCLANEKIKGSSSHPGVNYVMADANSWGLDDAVKSPASGGVAPFQPQRYLNVWVADLSDDLSGYAQMPGGPDQTDGIVIDYQFFGQEGTALAPYNEGKTLTHLIGNYLGLSDLWSEFSPCEDDGIFDTPIHNAPNNGCPDYKHISLCSEYPVEMTMNFMDNTFDACMNMFTFGQMVRMHAALSSRGPRHKLTTGKSECKPTEEVTFTGTPTDPSVIGTSLNQESISLDMHPNPANTTINLSVIGSDELVELIIYNSLGQIVLKQDFHGPDYRLNTSSWKDGVYLVHAQIGSQKFTHRLIISH